MNTETPLTVVDEPEKYAGEEALSDLPGIAGAAVQKEEFKNYATNKDIVAMIEKDIIPVVQQTRDDRVPLEEEWKSVRRMLMQIHDSGKKYNGRSDAYLPVWARTQSTICSNIVRGLFPTDDYIEANGEDLEVSKDDEKLMKSIMQDTLTRQCRLRAQMKLVVRDYVNYGIAIVKTGYQKEIKRKVKLKRGKDGVPVAASEPYNCDGARVYARNPFAWYCYPPTANNLEEATIVFEDIDISLAMLERLGKQGVFTNWELVSLAPVPEHENNVTSQLMDITKSTNSPLNNSYGDSPQGAFRTLTEVWTEMVLPKDAYLEGEDTSAAVSTKIVISGGVVLQVVRNPFWEQRPPYRVVRHEPMNGTFYGRSDGMRARSLQYLVNDFANQTNDNGTYMLNPVAKVNPALMAGPMPPLRPGVTVPMTDTAAGLVFDRPPFEQVNTGQALMMSHVTMLQDFVGAPPALQGTAGGKNAKTATGMQILQRNALGPIQDVVEDFENEMLVPVCSDVQGVLEQFAPDKFWVRDGDNRREVAREILSKNFGWKWLASSQAVNQQQRAQNLLNFIPLVAQLQPLLQQGGYAVDLEPLLASIFMDGFGMRGFDKIVFKAPMGPPGMAPGMPGMPPGPPQPGQPGQEAGVRSALSNSNNMADRAAGETMAPGEGEDFAEVRAEADQIAAALGAQYGGN